MLSLRPYQRECIDSIKEHFKNGECRQLVSLPTGSGKTVIFANLIKETGLRTLVLAHTNELLTQAKSKIQMICPGLEVGIVNAASKEFDVPVVVSSIQSARQPTNLKTLIEKQFGLVIYDECHHAASDTAKHVLDSLGFGAETDRLLVGFTATAFRGDGRGLGEVFDVIAYEKSIKDLIDSGYLSRPEGIKIANNIDFSKVKACDGDFQITSLAEVMDTPEINNHIVDSYLTKGGARKAICFGVTVQHANNLAHLFRERDVPAQAIYGDMPKFERESILEDYKRGSIQVLCNCQLLVEGFDNPATSCIIVGKPTQSKGSYQQMVGRGLRLYPNKKDCLVLDFSDKNHSICNTALLIEDAECIQYQEKEDRLKKKEILSNLPPNLNQKLKTALINFDPLGDDFVWKKVSTSHVMIGCENTKLIISYLSDDHYKVTLESRGNTTIIASNLNFEYAFATAEDYAKNNRQLFIISDKGAEWRNQPISKKQLTCIKSNGYKAGIEGLSRGQACDLIQSGSLKRRAR